jgi:hypothetical protein
VPLHVYPFCYESWFFNGLQPWVHFVPLALDGSDLCDVLEYCQCHEDEMEQIGIAGRNHMIAMASTASLEVIKAGFVEFWDLKLN